MPVGEIIAVTVSMATKGFVKQIKIGDFFDLSIIRTSEVCIYK